MRLSVLLICLVKLLRGIKMQTEIETFPSSVTRDCISASACTGRANRKICFMFSRGGWRRSGFLLLPAVARFLFWLDFFSYYLYFFILFFFSSRRKEQGRGRESCSLSSFCYKFSPSVRMKILFSQRIFFSLTIEAFKAYSMFMNSNSQ